LAIPPSGLERSFSPSEGGKGGRAAGLFPAAGKTGGLGLEKGKKTLIAIGGKKGSRWAAVTRGGEREGQCASGKFKGGRPTSGEKKRKGTVASGEKRISSFIWSVMPSKDDRRGGRRGKGLYSFRGMPVFQKSFIYRERGGRDAYFSLGKRALPKRCKNLLEERGACLHQKKKPLSKRGKRLFPEEAIRNSSTKKEPLCREEKRLPDYFSQKKRRGKTASSRQKRGEGGSPFSVKVALTFEVRKRLCLRGAAESGPVRETPGLEGKK